MIHYFKYTVEYLNDITEEEKSKVLEWIEDGIDGCDLEFGENKNLDYSRVIDKPIFVNVNVSLDEEDIKNEIEKIEVDVTELESYKFIPAEYSWYSDNPHPSDEEWDEDEEWEAKCEAFHDMIKDDYPECSLKTALCNYSEKLY